MVNMLLQEYYTTQVQYFVIRVLNCYRITVYCYMINMVYVS